MSRRDAFRWYQRLQGWVAENQENIPFEEAKKLQGVLSELWLAATRPRWYRLDLRLARRGMLRRRRGEK